MNAHVLVVDDDRDMCQLLSAGLTRKGFQVTWRTSAAEALEVVDHADLDAIVTDVEMAGMNGVELCERVTANRPDVPVTMLTAFGNFDTALAALRVGAYDFITKPPDMDALARSVERAVRHRTVVGEVKRLARADDATPAADGFLVGKSACMRRVVEVIERIGDSESSVMITGESGTGKELIARALHARSRRRAGPFVAVNCAALPGPLLESELFGHVRGAFTDARASRPGLFVRAAGGTLFLDEIGELPLALQPKLLRALQERTVRPVGSEEEIRCDVRVIAATNTDLDAALRARRFREDLYFRVNVIQIEAPPLRERGDEEILLLAQHFLTLQAAQTGNAIIGFTPAAAERLVGYSWPGNVRELQNCIERAVAVARHDRILVDDLPEPIANRRTQRPTLQVADTSATQESLEEVERRHIQRVLAQTKGNRSVTARILGVDRKTLYRKLTGYRAQG